MNSLTWTASSFAIVAYFNAAAAVVHPATAVPNVLSISILLIAFFHYQYILQQPLFIDRYRYSDWMLTCPLLVYEIALLLRLKPLGKDAWRVAGAAMASLLMIGSGWYANNATGANRLAWWAVGAVWLGLVYVLLLNEKPGEPDDTDDSLLPTIYLLLWIPYGLVFCAPESVKQVAFNVLDVVSKSSLGAIIAYRSMETTLGR